MPGTLTYNPFLPEVKEDPYPLYRALRERDPVHRSPDLPMWVLTRHRDVAAVLRDSRVSVDERRIDGYQPVPEGEGVARSMLFTDPPDHTRLRALVNTVFTPRRIQALRPRIEAIVETALARAAERGEMELIDELAYPLPVNVIATMLGVPAEDWPRFRDWSALLVRSLDPIQHLSASVQEEIVAARRSLADYLREIVQERTRAPRDDLISALVKAGEGSLSEPELLAMLVLLLVAGHETTVNLIGNGTLALLLHPEEMARLRDHPELDEVAVEELLRWDSPVQLTGRLALDDIDVDGHRVRRGEFLLLLLGAANRDPEEFGDPERLDLSRSPNHHLAFGRGIHFCLGAPLARLEGRVAITSLVRRFPGLRLAGEPERGETITLRGLRRLPLALV
jgi:cytochrome P450